MSKIRLFVLFIFFSFPSILFAALPKDEKGQGMVLSPLSEPEKKVLVCLAGLANKPEPDEFINEVLRWKTDKPKPLCIKVLAKNERVNLHHIIQNIYPYLFGRQFRNLYLIDNACIVENKEVCALEEDPLTLAQDLSRSPWKVEKKINNGSSYQIETSTIFAGKKPKPHYVNFIMAKDEAGIWKIKDVCSPTNDYCVVSKLSQNLKKLGYLK